MTEREISKMTPKFVGRAAGRMVMPSLRLDTREEKYMLGKEESFLTTL